MHTITHFLEKNSRNQAHAQIKNVNIYPMLLLQVIDAYLRLVANEHQKMVLIIHVNTVYVLKMVVM